MGRGRVGVVLFWGQGCDVLGRSHEVSIPVWPGRDCSTWMRKFAEDSSQAKDFNEVWSRTGSRPWYIMMECLKPWVSAKCLSPQKKHLIRPLVEAQMNALYQVAQKMTSTHLQPTEMQYENFPFAQCKAIGGLVCSFT
ncbi:hypothetical protein XELAEV_18041837mg [Xenopus laevis]|uniref:Uncharacterized protein n=1 Tax=Xenopus laevis TaxID=8355 RepID=A0A974H5I0_XENLA|nr:hypothetical protein XELAEV_18041837mg [Xenopus laevis]